MSSELSVNPRAENKSSSLLTKDENDQIFRLLGHKCQTLATCVVQLFLTELPQHKVWSRQDCGVLCLVKDNVRRSYFFRLFCLSRCAMVWEQEVYNHIQYRASHPFFHSFEGEDCLVAFNFADVGEARVIRAVLLEKIEAKRQRKNVRKSRASMGQPPDLPKQPVVTSNGPMHVSSTPVGPKAVPKQQGKTKWPTRRGKEKENARRLTKADIGMPQDFRHVTHVGWDPNKGFDLDNVEDPQLKQFFIKAGVSESQLKDQETREFIYDFINKHGGIEAVKEEVIQALPQALALQHSAPGPPPPVPARTAPPPVESKPSWSQARSAPPPPPSRVQANTAAPPPPPVRSAPPPRPPAPPEPSAAVAAANIPPPPPPPPMLPPAEPMAPPVSVPRAPTTAAAPDPRSALLDAIRMGKQLKHVEPGASASAPSNSNARGDLLDQIRQGIELRKITPSNTSASKQQDVATQDTLAGALARALAERSRAIHSDSDSTSDSEDEEDDDDEWED